MTVRSSWASWSSRAVISAEIVGGMSSAPRSPTSSQLPSSQRQLAVVDQHRQRLLDVQRIALGRLAEPLLDDARDAGRAEQIGHHLLALGSRERLQVDLDGVRPVGCPLRPLVEQFAAGRAHAGARARSTLSHRCSIRSRKVGSAQWMSSNTMTSGPSAAKISSSRRVAQNVSCSEKASADRPITAASRSATSAFSAPTRASSLARAACCGSSGDAPVAWAMAARSAQNVMPSP